MLSGFIYLNAVFDYSHFSVEGGRGVHILVAISPAVPVSKEATNSISERAAPSTLSDLFKIFSRC